MLQGFIGKPKRELPTPSLLLDIQAVDENIRKMADLFSDRECKLRPHAKTHKLPWIAHRQVRAGAIGITCAKLQDAKGFVEAGVESVLIANQVVGDEKIRELVNLSRLAKVMVCVDHVQNAEHLSSIAREMGVIQPVLVEVDVGTKRCGVQPGQGALDFVRRISGLKGIFFKGLMGYEGGLFNMEEGEKAKVCKESNRLLIATKEVIERDGFEVPVVSAGGSNTHEITGRCPGITDIQPGSYVTMDDWNAAHGIEFRQAVTLLSTVISRPERGRAVLDVGLKAISTDHGLPRVISHQRLEIEAMNEEHGKLNLKDSDPDLKVGDRVEIVPSHGCTTIPLYGHYIAMKGDRAIAALKVLSGGANY